ncbi:MAG: peptide chain release factor N(5)-glutamine methyltransferase [Bacteroidota bacterium]
MKLKELADKFANELTPLYDQEEAKAIFLLIIEHYLKLNRSSYNFKKEEELADGDIKLLQLTLNQLKTGKPIQYILGETLFYGLPFKVNEAILIPRPETEELVAWVIEKIKDSESKTLTENHQQLTILDIGTGSGCIAISLKKNLSGADVTALDISSKALAIAKENAVLNDVEVSFIEQDILNTQYSILNTQYAILVSNPPYITETEKTQMHENVLANEPHLALFVSNEKPLIFYEAIADFALKNLTNNGLLFFEINEYLGNETVQMLVDKGFNNIELRKDMQGKDRMICCNFTT